MPHSIKIQDLLHTGKNAPSMQARASWAKGSGHVGSADAFGDQGGRSSFALSCSPDVPAHNAGSAIYADYA